jgi:hypothetical protein
MKTKKNIKKAEAHSKEFLNNNNKIITIVISEENMHFVVLHHPSNSKSDVKVTTAKVSDLPDAAALNFDFDDNEDSYKIIFTGNRDKILIGDFYSLLNENRRINKKQSGKKASC